MHPYHEVRHEVFGSKIPPSTSNLHQRLSRTGQTTEIQIVAAIPGAELSRPSTRRSSRRDSAFRKSRATARRSAPATSASCPAIPRKRSARANRPRSSPSVRDPRALWRKWPVKLEADFIIKRKLIPSPGSGAGASIDSVVKAQVYLTDRRGCAGLQRGLAVAFQESAGHHDHRNRASRASPSTICASRSIRSRVAAKGKTKREIIRGPEPPTFDGWVSAVKCGDLLFLSGLMAVEGGRLIDAARVDARQPFYGIPVKAELRSIVRQAEAICRAAGTSLAQRRPHPAIPHRSRRSAGRNRGLGRGHGPCAAAPVARSKWPWLPVPGARVQVDLWVYVPQ